MDTSLKLQIDVKNNAEDLKNYMLDLSNWEEEMKRKESQLSNAEPYEQNIPPPRNKIEKLMPEKEKSNSSKPKRISAYDYCAWDKFDVEKACAEIDEKESDGATLKKESSEEIKSEDEEEEEEGEKDCEDKTLSLVDEAFYEKELGNQFVKKEQWNNAIECYTNAINLDPKNPIYYSNRSLCFLKLKNFKCAEVDATVAIQLDKNYVKAYQRRALAKLALGQLSEAKEDYEKILIIEPKNALARLEINKINEKLNKEKKINKTSQEKTFNHKGLFKSQKESNSSSVSNTSASSSSISSSKESKEVLEGKRAKKLIVENTTKEKRIEEKESPPLIKNLKVEKGDGDKSFSAKKKLSVFKPLPEWCNIINPINVPPHKRSKKGLKRINIIEVDSDDKMNSEEQKVEPFEKRKANNLEIYLNKKDEIDSCIKENLFSEVPKTSIQFQNCWKILKNNSKEAYSYLKKIPGSKLPEIFESSLEINVFSDLVTFLANDDVEKNPEVIYDFLLGLSKVKRFSSLILFMSANDKECVKNCIAKVAKIKPNEEVSNLLQLYEL